MLILILLIPFIIFCIFIGMMVKITIFDKSYKSNLGEKIMVLLFTLAIVGGIFRAIQLGFACYRDYGTIWCGGGAPDDEQDYLFPQPK